LNVLFCRCSDRKGGREVLAQILPGLGIFPVVGQFLIPVLSLRFMTGSCGGNDGFQFYMKFVRMYHSVSAVLYCVHMR
jgi:hypothetical protein